MVAEVSIVYQVRGLGRVFVSDNGAELANGLEVARRVRGRWKITEEMGGTEYCRLEAVLLEHDRVQGCADTIAIDDFQRSFDRIFGLRGGK